MEIVFALLSPSRKSLRMLLRQTVTTRRSYAYQRCMSTTYGTGRTFRNCRDSGLVQSAFLFHNTTRLELAGVMFTACALLVVLDSEIVLRSTV